MAVTNTGQGNSWSNHYEVFIVSKQGIWRPQKLVHWNPGKTNPLIVSELDDQYDAWGFATFEEAFEMAELLEAELGSDEYLFIPVHNRHVEKLGEGFKSAWSDGANLPF